MLRQGGQRNEPTAHWSRERDVQAAEIVRARSSGRFPLPAVTLEEVPVGAPLPSTGRFSDRSCTLCLRRRPAAPVPRAALAAFGLNGYVSAYRFDVSLIGPNVNRTAKVDKLRKT
jgi:hypothetical protein